MDSAVATETAVATPRPTSTNRAAAMIALRRRLGRRSGRAVRRSLARPTIGYREAKMTKRWEAEKRGVQVVSTNVGSLVCFSTHTPDGRITLESVTR